MLKVLCAVLVALVVGSCGGGGDPTAAPTSAAMMASPVAARSQGQGPSASTLVASPVSIVNTTTAGDQMLRTIGSTADGGYVVVWTSGGDTLFMQAYDSTGARSGGEVRIPVVISGVSDDAARQAIGRSSVAVLTDGSVVVAYNVFRTVELPGGLTSSSSGAFFQRFDGSGNQLQPETEIAVHAFEGPKGHVVEVPTALALSDGGFVVAWALTHYSAQFGTISTLSLRWYDSQGQLVGSPAEVGDFPALNYRLAADTTGGFTLSVAETDNFFNREFFVLHYDASHAFVEVVTPRFSDVLLLPLGSGYVLFASQNGAATAQILDSQGNPVGTAMPIASMPVAARELADGTYVAIEAQGTGFVAQRFAADGTVLGAPIAIDSGAARPAIVALAETGFAAAWTTTSVSGDTDVATQRFVEPFSARKKACLDSAKAAGLKGQQRKAFVDACMA